MTNGNECEACKSEVQNELKDRYTDVVYYLCANCLTELITLSLTKQHYKALLDAGHTDDEFWIHDDFYDEDGTATQSMFEE